MEIKNIKTVRIYAYATRLSFEAKDFEAEVAKAKVFRNEGFMSDEQYRALCVDREKKAAPFREQGKLLADFARAVDARNAMETSGNIMAQFMVANAKPVESFDLDAIKAAIDCAIALEDPMPC